MRYPQQPREAMPQRWLHGWAPGFLLSQFSHKSSSLSFPCSHGVWATPLVFLPCTSRNCLSAICSQQPACVVFFWLLQPCKHLYYQLRVELLPVNRPTVFFIFLIGHKLINSREDCLWLTRLYAWKCITCRVTKGREEPHPGQDCGLH